MVFRDKISLLLAMQGIKNTGLRLYCGFPVVICRFSHLSICGFLWITDHVGAFDGQHAGEIIREKKNSGGKKGRKDKNGQKIPEKPRRAVFLQIFGWPD